MNKLIYRVLFFVLIMSNLNNGNAQHKIDISIPSFAGDTLIFGNYFRKSLMIKDSAILDQNGRGIFKGKENLPDGLYAIFLSNKKWIDIIIDKNQFFSISVDTSDLIRKTVIKNDPENKRFFEYQKYLMDKRELATFIENRIKNPISVSDSILAKTELDSLNKEVLEYIDVTTNNNPSSFLSTLLVSLREVEVPDPSRDKNGLIDSTFQYRYYKSHYFDNFDLSDVRLLRTPYYEKHLIFYLDKLIIPYPDSIYKEVDWLVEKARADTFLFQYMLTTLFNYYAERMNKFVGMDAIYVYIAEKYYIPEAHWSNPKFLTELSDRIKKLKPLLIGKDAPDIQLVKIPDDHFKLAATDTLALKNPYVGDFFNLRNIDAKFILLYFWESDCGHCKKSIPELFRIYNTLKDKGVQIVAVHMLTGVEGKVKWVDFINNEKLYGWINAWNPYDFSYREIYDITSSNILYLIDENKKILAKKLSPEQAEKIILEELKRKTKL